MDTKEMLPKPKLIEKKNGEEEEKTTPRLYKHFLPSSRMN